MLANPITFAKGLGTGILSVIVMTFFALPAFAEETATLTTADCVKCHKEERRQTPHRGDLS